MPRTRLDQPRADPDAVRRLINRYARAEREISLEAAVGTGYVPCTVQTVYNKMKEPEKFKLCELRGLAKALKIPWEDMSKALAAALGYQGGDAV